MLIGRLCDRQHELKALGAVIQQVLSQPLWREVCLVFFSFLLLTVDAEVTLVLHGLDEVKQVGLDWLAMILLVPLSAAVAVQGTLSAEEEGAIFLLETLDARVEREVLVHALGVSTEATYLVLELAVDNHVSATGALHDVSEEALALVLVGFALELVAVTIKIRKVEALRAKLLFDQTVFHI